MSVNNGIGVFNGGNSSRGTSGGGGGSVNSVTGFWVDNTDPANPIITVPSDLITGTGEARYLTFWDSANTISTATEWWYGTNGKLGVNTDGNDPLALLTVVDSSVVAGVPSMFGADLNVGRFGHSNPTSFGGVELIAPFDNNATGGFFINFSQPTDIAPFVRGHAAIGATNDISTLPFVYGPLERTSPLTFLSLPQSTISLTGVPSIVGTPDGPPFGTSFLFQGQNEAAPDGTYYELPDLGTAFYAWGNKTQGPKISNQIHNYVDSSVGTFGQFTVAGRIRFMNTTAKQIDVVPPEWSFDLIRAGVTQTYTFSSSDIPPVPVVGTIYLGPLDNFPYEANYDHDAAFIAERVTAAINLANIGGPIVATTEGSLTGDVIITNTDGTLTPFSFTNLDPDLAATTSIIFSDGIAASLGYNTYNDGKGSSTIGPRVSSVPEFIPLDCATITSANTGPYDFTTLTPPYVIQYQLGGSSEIYFITALQNANFPTGTVLSAVTPSQLVTAINTVVDGPIGNSQYDIGRRVRAKVADDGRVQLYCIHGGVPYSLLLMSGPANNIPVLLGMTTDTFVAGTDSTETTSLLVPGSSRFESPIDPPGVRLTARPVLERAAPWYAEIHANGALWPYWNHPDGNDYPLLLADPNDPSASGVTVQKPTTTNTVPSWANGLGKLRDNPNGPYINPSNGYLGVGPLADDTATSPIEIGFSGTKPVPTLDPEQVVASMAWNSGLAGASVIDARGCANDGFYASAIFTPASGVEPAGYSVFNAADKFWVIGGEGVDSLIFGVGPSSTKGLAYNHNTLVSQETDRAFEIFSSTAGSKAFPSYTSVQRAAIVGKEAGEFFYDTTTNTPWYFNGTIDVELATSSGGGWLVGGNTLAATGFFGSLNPFNVELSANGLAHIRLNQSTVETEILTSLITNGVAPSVTDAYNIGTTTEWYQNVHTKSLRMHANSQTLTMAADSATTSYQVTWPAAPPVSTSILQMTSGGYITFGSGAAGPASPANSIQFNNAGAFGGDAALTWTGTDFHAHTFQSGSLTAGVNRRSPGAATQFFFQDGAAANYVNIQAPNAALAASYTLTLPTGLPGSTQFLQSNNTGALSFASAVTSVGLSVPTSSLFSVTGSPVTGSGTLDILTSGTSGGIPYFSSATQMNSSGVIGQNQLILGGGVGSAPTTVSLGASGTLLVGTGGAPVFTASPVIGQNGVLAGILGIANGTGGGASVSIYNRSTTSAWNMNLPATAGTSGQVLASGGGGTNDMTWVDRISGSGTNKYIPRFSGTSALTDSSMIDNGGVIGINISPVCPLDVMSISGTGGISPPNYTMARFANTASGEDCYVNIQSSTTGQAGVVFGDTTAADAAAIEWDRANIKLSFQTANTERMYMVNNDDGIFLPSLGSDTGTALIITAGDQVQKQTSSRRYKKNIKPISFDTSSVLNLNVVEFDYKGSNTHDFGLIAEDVAEVSEYAINRDAEGRVESIRSDHISYMLLEEVKKQRNYINEIKAKYSDLKTKFDTLLTHLQSRGL